MSVELTVAVVAFIGVIVGGLVQALAVTANERWKYRVCMRTEAYKSLMDAVANLSLYTGYAERTRDTISAAHHAKQILVYQTQMAAAQTKVALYRSKRVLREVSEFFSKHAALREGSDYEKFIDFVAAMRADSYAADYTEFRRHLDDMMLRGAQKS